ncbi:MarR family winged helix-turn-helix transcriptional regulator, partial [Dysosmobacter welbionis]
QDGPGRGAESARQVELLSAPPPSPAGGVLLPLRLSRRLRRGLCQRRDLQDAAQWLRRHQPWLPLPDRRAGLCHVLRLGHPAPGGGSLGQDPHRRSGARLAVEGRCQRPHLSQSLTGGNHPMKTVRLTMAQALVRFLENQYIEVDGEQSRFVRGVF